MISKPQASHLLMVASQSYSSIWRKRGKLGKIQQNWLVAEPPHLKNMSQNDKYSPNREEHKRYLGCHHLVFHCTFVGSHFSGGGQGECLMQGNFTCQLTKTWDTSIYLKGYVRTMRSMHG